MLKHPHRIRLSASTFIPKMMVNSYRMEFDFNKKYLGDLQVLIFETICWKSLKPVKEFFKSDTDYVQSLFGVFVIFPIFSFPEIIPRNLFSFSGDNNEQSKPDPRFKMILWFIVAGTRGGANRAKILNLVKDTPMNANKIATALNLDYKTVIHHVKILSKNDLVVKAQKTYGAEYQLSEIMKENQDVLQEIMSKIGAK